MKFLEFDEQTIEKTSKYHCWPQDKISDVYEYGYIHGAKFQHSHDKEIWLKLLKVNKVLLLCLILWNLIGIASFLYWWTKEYDVTYSDLFVMFLYGSLGPLSVLILWFIFGKSKETILIKKRSKK